MLEVTVDGSGNENENGTKSANDNHHHYRSFRARERRHPMDWQEDGPSELPLARIERQGRTRSRTDSPSTAKRSPSFRRRRPEYILSSDDEPEYSETDVSFSNRPRHLRSSAQSHHPFNTLPTEASLPHIQATLSSDSQKDITLHFDLDFADDIEGHLEELARLKRLGHFHDAVDYFAINLEQHLNLPLVIIEYADLLQEQGAYRELLDLQSRGILELPQKMGSGDTPKLYIWHLDVIQKHAKSAFEGLSKRDISEGTIPQILEHVEQWLSFRLSNYLDQKPADPVDWTELQLFRKFLDLLSNTYINDVLPPDRPLWTGIYDDLLEGERIWDISDVILSMINMYEPQQVLIDLFNDPFDHDTPEEDQDPLARLLEDLESDEYDELTELAILSILVGLTYAIESSDMPKNEQIITARRCLQHASLHARLVEEQSPELTRSRPYLLYILAKEQFQRCWGGNRSSMRERRRPAVYTTGMACAVGGIPSYIPVEAENPGWPSPDPKFPPNRVLEDILQSARELGDYEVEAVCLMELICRVEDPKPLLDQLERLRKSTQGYYTSYIQTCISRYLLVNDKTSAQNLLWDLEQSTSRLCTVPGKDAFPPFRWNELKVKNALHLTLSGPGRDTHETMHLANALLDDHRGFRSSPYTRYLRFEDEEYPHIEVAGPSRPGIRDRKISRTIRGDRSWIPRNAAEMNFEQNTRVSNLEQAIQKDKQQLERPRPPGEQCTDLVVASKRGLAKDEYEREFDDVSNSKMVWANDRTALTKKIQAQT